VSTRLLKSFPIVFQEMVEAYALYRDGEPLGSLIDIGSSCIHPGMTINKRNLSASKHSQDSLRRTDACLLTLAHLHTHITVEMVGGLLRPSQPTHTHIDTQTYVF
jgi:hypothetical protein